MEKSMTTITLAIAHLSMVTLVSRLSEKGILSRAETIKIFEEIGVRVERVADTLDQPGDHPDEMEDFRKRIQHHANQYYDDARALRDPGNSHGPMTV